MIYALDTNIISFLLRPSQNTGVVHNFNEIVKLGHAYVIPPLCYYEVFWYLQRKNALKQLQLFGKLYNDSLQNFIMGKADFILASKLKVNLVEKGTPIGNNDADIFIAAYCINNGYILVTDNKSDFEYVDNLHIVNWKE